MQEKYTQAGGKAWARGDLRAAIAAQERALIAARSVEDEEGIALRILDLAALHRAAGEPAEARSALAELLEEPPALAYPPRWRAAAARLAGLLALDGGDPAGGARWAARALELCRMPACPEAGAIVNLQARAAFIAGDLEGAIIFAKRSQSLNRAAKDREETANSSRIIADAELGSGRPAAAARAYSAALALDKKLGLDAKILLDLVGLGRAAQDEGRTREALDYFKRASAVARAGGNEKATAEINALIEALASAVR